MLVLLVVPLSSVLAYKPFACDSSSVTIERDLPMREEGPTFQLVVRYPNGDYRRYVGDEIPHRVSVPKDSTVRLEVVAYRGKSGRYTVRACARTLTELPGQGIVDVHAHTVARSGEMEGYASVEMLFYWRNLDVKLEVSFSYIGQSQGWTLGKTVIVSLEAASSTTSSSTLLVTMTNLSTGSSPSATAGGIVSRTTSSSSTYPSTTTIIEAGSSPTGTTSGASGSSSGQPAGGEGVLTINPSSMRVDAGDIAVFDLCTSLSSPTFRVEGLPTGYRYVITPSGDCYKLKVFTHPLSYGRFEMTVVARSGGAEERGSLSILVRRAETSSPATSYTSTEQPPAPSPTLEGTVSEEVIQTTSTRATEAPPVTVVTVIKKEKPPIELLAGSGVALLLVVLLALLLVRKRR